MSKIRTVIEQRPNYYLGQLLLDEDFLAEQNYHITARHRHNKNLHGWGVVHGLTVSCESANSIVVNPGFAVDRSGSEIFFEEPRVSEGGAGAPRKRRNFCAVVTVSEISENIAGLILATVQLDSQGKVSEEAIDYSQTRYARNVAPGSITSTELHEDLRKGWLRMPFRPDPMVEGPEEGTEEGLPAFRVGTTEARSPHSTDVERDKGAAGTMAIPIPPSVKQVTRLRIAGSENKGEITLRLILGGWDREKGKHVRDELLRATIPSEQPFFKEYPIPITKTSLDPEYNTLALWLRGTRSTAVSLIAVEFGY